MMKKKAPPPKKPIVGGLIKKSPGKPSKKDEESKDVVVSFETKGPYTNKPSAKYTSIKTADPFATSAKKHKTAFGYVYTSGGVPCRIQHGGITNHLVWDKPVVRIFLE